MPQSQTRFGGVLVQWLFLLISTPRGFLTPAPLVLHVAVRPAVAEGERADMLKQGPHWKDGVRSTRGVASLYGRG